jgi:hypothetical protein
VREPVRPEFAGRHRRAGDDRLAAALPRGGGEPHPGVQSDAEGVNRTAVEFSLPTPSRLAEWSRPRRLPNSSRAPVKYKTLVELQFARA